jgi:GNAT superfamily N-acetyltransferase
MDATEACDASIVYSMAVMAAWCGAQVVDDADALFVVGKTRFPTPFTNAVFPKTDERAEATMRRAAELFADRRYIVWGRGHSSKMASLAEGRGFTSFKSMPGMVIESKVTDVASPLDIRLVTSAADFSEFVDVQAASFAELGLPLQVTRSLFADRDAALASGTLVLARAEGTPVSGAIAVTDAATGVAGVYWVGTSPDARRRGGADAVTRVVTNAAFDQGATIVTLQASAAGEPVYLRMGYREACRYDRFLSPARE